MVDYRILYDHLHLASLECQPVWSRIGNTRVMVSRAEIYSMSKMIALVLFKFLPRCQHIWLLGPVRSHPSCDQDCIISYFCDCPLNMYIYIYIYIHRIFANPRYHLFCFRFADKCLDTISICSAK